MGNLGTEKRTVSTFPLPFRSKRRARETARPEVTHELVTSISKSPRWSGKHCRICFGWPTSEETGKKMKKGRRSRDCAESYHFPYVHYRQDSSKPTSLPESQEAQNTRFLYLSWGKQPKSAIICARPIPMWAQVDSWYVSDGRQRISTEICSGDVEMGLRPPTSCGQVASW